MNWHLSGRTFLKHSWSRRFGRSGKNWERKLKLKNCSSDSDCCQSKNLVTSLPLSRFPTPVPWSLAFTCKLVFTKISAIIRGHVGGDGGGITPPRRSKFLTPPRRPKIHFDPPQTEKFFCRRFFF